jgi:hypothetical protein
MMRRKTELQRSEPPPDKAKRDVADNGGSRRFALRLAIRCRRLGVEFISDRIVVGKSVSIGSKGLLFKASEAFPPGQVVEAFIDWPMRLYNGVRLTLVVEGVVVRSAGNQVEVCIEKYEFRTRAAVGALVR